MSHLWVRDSANGGRWAAARLDDDRGTAYLLEDGATAIRRGSGRGRIGQTVLVAAAAPGPRNAAARWLLLVGPGSDVRVNGQALAAVGVRVLADRDEIRLPAGTRLFFSTERQAQVGPFPGLEKPAFCPRCQQPIEKGSPAVQCPGCSAWYHQSAQFPCWTYAPTCALCDQTTELEAGFQWTPAQL